MAKDVGSKKGKKKNRITSVETEKALDRIEKRFHDEMLRKLEVEGNLFNMIKVVYEKNTANAQWSKTECFQAMIRYKTKMPTLPLLFSEVMKRLAKTIRQVKNKRHSN